MRKSWWKILGVALIIYSFTMGLLVPLKPGISYFSPGSMSSGQEYTLAITGYNTFYTKAETAPRVWLKYNNDLALIANKVEVVDDRTLQATIEIPKYLPKEEQVSPTSLIVDDDFNGFALMPGAIYIKQDSFLIDRTNLDSIIIDSLIQDSILQVQIAKDAWAVAEINNIHIKEEFNFPFRVQLSETIRNLYYHVPFWFAMFIIFIAGITQSIKYLSTGNAAYDYKSMSFTLTGTMFGIIGLCTGMIWAKDTWGTYWTWNEVKMNMTAIALLIYLAYFILRYSFDDDERRARISAVYSIFAFAAMIALLYVVPRMVSSLHPGSGGNPALGADDLDNSMRLVFYPAIIGWTLIGVWLTSLIYRMRMAQDKLYDL